MGSGRSPLLLLLLLLLFWGDFALWGSLHSVSGLFEGSCSIFPNDSQRCGEPKNRFFYNITSKSCEPFVYHGCPGNRNRYHTIEECQRYCGNIEKPGFCPPSPRGASGPCWTRCLHDGSCPEMEKCCSYGCALYCMKPVTDLCQLPSEPGPCDLKVKRWFYDPKIQRCKKFTYGGCAGNANNFKKHLECRLRCRKRGTP
ncbi:BPTI/Kunitz domain-containing protein-like isoform X1 [Pseudonaja textilis]|uniref:BPTI/Kunitz domain-containing protein-like isoform X1 n=1 Tax=Pseudonaja textilis TaxID=8673 RepID=UPI000EA8D0F2|nr:BPTI/Kunitz domain-containing protein-like isoform X1 [Pseudonaja textilis]XP_026579408.1 BPTI/Kunitz domain-containing protein-like isoform X1 [Pseudonaja textilis]